MKQITSLLQKKELSSIKHLQKKIPQAEIFLIGGIVRDSLIGRESKDYDFVIRNVSVNKLLKFLKTLGWVDIVGKKFGVLKFMPKNSTLKEPLDIALPRTEHAFLTGGYKDFDIQSDPNLPIEEDLKRRDFTINALAYDINKKEIIDLFNGLKDLKKKNIKTVGLATERFKEDYSRILRAIRFACQLNFKIDNATWSAIKKLTPQINKKVKGEFLVPRETIAKEMTKAFVANPALAFELYDKSGLTKALMPELLKMKKCPQPRNFHSEGDVWKHTLLCLQNLSSKKFTTKYKNEKLDAELVFATLFHDIGKPYTIERSDRLRFNNHDTVGAKITDEIIKRLKLSSAGIKAENIVWLCSKHMISTHTKKSPMKKTTLEKYFFNENVPGHNLLKLTFADIQATIPKDGQPNFKDFNKIVKQVEALEKISRNKKVLPKELINGNEIMKALKIKPGAKIGKIKNALREEQLKGNIKTKKQSFDYIKKYE
ncbi:MAG: CCA tRNA nucleotidyltransferase [Candidatus Kerfeldbacteria bacterium]